MNAQKAPPGCLAQVLDFVRAPIGSQQELECSLLWPKAFSAIDDIPVTLSLALLYQDCLELSCTTLAGENLLSVRVGSGEPNMSIGELVSKLAARLNVHATQVQLLVPNCRLQETSSANTPLTECSICQAWVWRQFLLAAAGASMLERALRARP